MDDKKLEEIIIDAFRTFFSKVRKQISKEQVQRTYNSTCLKVGIQPKLKKEKGE